MAEEQTLYEKLGGDLAVRALVIRIYNYILEDDELASFFKYVEVDRLKYSLIVFVEYALNGPRTYTTEFIRNAHKEPVKQGLTDKHFDLVADYLAKSMRDTKMPESAVDYAMARVAERRNDVLRR